MKLSFIAILLLSLLYGESYSTNKIAHLIKKGKKVALKVCEKEKLLKIRSREIETIYKQIDKIKPCIELHKRDIEALGYFLISKNIENDTIETIKVPKESKCPVCGMFIDRYPKWVSYMKIGKRDFYFDGVKDMMKYYIFNIDFPYDRENIKDIRVTDFYTLKSIDAKEAFYVVGSDIYGPMGEELIPFQTKKESQSFILDHKGERVIRFKDIEAELIMKLDGIEYNN